MKKVLMAIICIMMIATLVMAQSRRKPQYSSTQTSLQISIRPILGFGLGTGKYVVGTESELDTNWEYVKSNNIYYSAGEGLKMGVAGDFAFLEGIAAGLELGYSMGFDKEIDKIKYYSGTTWVEGNAKEKTSYLFCNPTLRVGKKMMIRGFGYLVPFCTFGPTLAIAPKTTWKYENTTGTPIVKQEGEGSYGLGIGYFGILGIEYPLMKNISIFGQLKIDQLSLKASKGKITKWTEDGKDILKDKTVNEKETEYKDDIGSADTTSTQPDVQNTFIVPANSIGINMGVAISF